ncbi:MAG: nicotinate (nicotinamide) nucleotide adenylyltransferase [Myxococcales bacterium]|nr:nicotinate (nicotinamide) nucleotide adenylyltransferase [Myxococcales bacterium]
MKRVAFYGGSFNPPHFSHFFAMTWALCCGEVDEVWMVPCAEHAFGKDLAPFEHRVEMCKRGISAFSSPDKIKVQTIEQRLPRPSYTIHTIEALQREHPDHSFRLLIGSDILNEKEKWHDFSRLVELAPLLLIGRAGVKVEEAVFEDQHLFPGSGKKDLLNLQEEIVLPEISSTEIRKRLALSSEVRTLLPAPILEYIQSNHLYKKNARS